MSEDEIGLMCKMNELLVAVLELRSAAEGWKAKALIAEVELKGAIERSQMILEAKNMWMERALAVERTSGTQNRAE